MVDQNSSTQPTLSALARRLKPKRARDFLLELLNLRDDPPAAARFCLRFKEFLEKSWRPELGDNVASNISLLASFRAELHKAWVQPTAIARQASLFFRLGEWLQFLFVETSLQDLRSGQPAWHGGDALEIDAEELKEILDEGRQNAVSEGTLVNRVVALLYALNNADRMRFCGNPECPAPHFFAMRRSQKYCSDSCSLPAQREFKRKWWDEHGNAWRKSRKTSAKKSQRKRGK